MLERAPGSKRKPSSSSAVGQSSKVPVPGASNPRKRPRKSDQDTSDATSVIPIRPQPPWSRFPSRDPFYDLLCDAEDGDDTTPEETSTDPSQASSSSSPPNSALSLYSPAIAPDSDIPQSDLPYISFFLAEMSNVLPYVTLFPSTVPSLFASSIHHPALRHSVLSVSSLISDKKHRRGKQRALEHLQKSLKLLQASLSAPSVDEGIAIAIFLLVYFGVANGEHSSARKHLAGLHLVLTQLQQEHLARNAGVASPYAISPLTMLVWRMAVRMDFVMALVYGQRPIFPMYPSPLSPCVL
jgi:hypothetical protein